MSENISEFLVGLGFRLDEPGQRKFQEALLTATANAAKLAVGLEAAATAAVVAVQRIAANFETLSYSSERTNTSIAHLKAFQFAMSQVGSSAEEALALIESFGQKMRNIPSLGDHIKTTFDVNVKDIKGNLRELDDILEDIVKSPRFQNMEYYIKKQQFELLGGTEHQMQGMMREHGQFLEEYRKKAGAFGLDLRKAGDEARVFQDAWRSLWETAGIAMEKLGGDFQERLAKRFIQFDEWLVQHGPGIVAGFEKIGDAVLYMADKIGEAATKLHDFFVKNLDPWAEKTLGIQDASSKLIGVIIGAAGMGLIAAITGLGIAIGGLVAGTAFKTLFAFLSMFGLTGAAVALGAAALGISSAQASTGPAGAEGSAGDPEGRHRESGLGNLRPSRGGGSGRNRPGGGSGRSATGTDFTTGRQAKIFGHDTGIAFKSHGGGTPKTGGGGATPGIPAGTTAHWGDDAKGSAGPNRGANYPLSDAQRSEMAAAIRKTAAEIGADPEQLAAVMSFETGGTMDPWKSGPHTKWGHHRGLIQWGEPQRAQYGVDQNTSIADQVAAAGRYIKDRGYQPGMRLENLYGSVIAGSATSNLDARDANNTSARSGAQAMWNSAHRYALANLERGQEKAKPKLYAMAEGAQAATRDSAVPIGPSGEWVHHGPTSNTLNVKNDIKINEATGAGATAQRMSDHLNDAKHPDLHRVVNSAAQ